MAKALYMTALGSCKTLKNLLRTAKSWERPRLIMLLEMQKAGEVILYKILENAQRKISRIILPFSHYLNHLN